MNDYQTSGTLFMYSSILTEEEEENECVNRGLKSSSVCALCIYWSPIWNSQATYRTWPYTGEWTEKMSYIYTMEYSWPVKNHEIPLLMTTGRSQEERMLNEVSQAQEDEHHIISLMWIQKSYLREAENRLLVSRSRKAGETRGCCVRREPQLDGVGDPCCYREGDCT